MKLEEASYKVYKEAVTKHPSGMYCNLFHFDWLILSSADMYEKLIGWCMERLQQHGNQPSVNFTISFVGILSYHPLADAAATIRCTPNG